jgi:hypothetical protein
MKTLVRTVAIVALFCSSCLAGDARWRGPIPQPLEEHVKTLADNRVPIECIAWDGQNSWICVTPTEVRSGGPLPQNLANYLGGLRANGSVPRCVFFNHTGSWTVINPNGSMKWEGMPPPQAAMEYIQGAQAAGANLLSLAYLPSGAWSVITDRNFACGNVPPDMFETLQILRSQNLPIRSSSFAPNGKWIIGIR